MGGGCAALCGYLPCCMAWISWSFFRILAWSIPLWWDAMLLWPSNCSLYHSLSSTRSMMMSRHLCWIRLLHRMTWIWSLHTCWMLYLATRNLRSHILACMLFVVVAPCAICATATFLGNFTGKGTFCFTRWLRVTDNFWGIRKCGVGSSKLTQYGLYIMSLNRFWWECKLTSDNDVTRYQSWKVGWQWCYKVAGKVGWQWCYKVAGKVGWLMLQGNWKVGWQWSMLQGSYLEDWLTMMLQCNWKVGWQWCYKVTGRLADNDLTR